MRFSLGLPTDRVDLGAEFGTGAAVMELARAAEQFGFDAVFVTEHPIPEKSWMDSGGHHALDPFVALAFAAAATTRLRLLTNLCVVPYRNPFLLAKSAASLDALSGGRLVLGAGAGYLEAEFRALGVPFEERNERFDEAIGVMRKVWSGELVSESGRGWEASGHFALPRPVQRPGPPIWIGGNSKRAVRRAVELAEGWMPFPNPAKSVGRRHTPAMVGLDDLRARIAYLREHAQRVGRKAPVEITYMPIAGGTIGGAGFDARVLRDHIAEQAALGVTQLSVGVPGESRAEWLRNAEAYAKQVLSVARAL
jgi:probable F420-dependent oxidoreductase